MPHIDWKIPCITLNECHKNFIKFYSENFFTRLNELTRKSGNILDLLLCTAFRQNSISFNQLTFTDHNVICFNINVDNGIKLTSRNIYLNFYKVDFENVNEYLLGIIWKLLYNKSKNLKLFLTNL